MEEKIVFTPNGEYNFPIGTEYYRYKEPFQTEGKLIKCRVTGRIWISVDMGGVYECMAESEVGSLDCNWNINYSISTSVSDKELFEAQERGDMVCI